MDIPIAQGYKEPKVYEKLNGKLILMPRPHADHIELQWVIESELRQYMKDKMCRVFNEIDVFISGDNVIPDVCVLCDLDKLKNGRIYGAPDLIVEVTSPSTKHRDIGYKKSLYEKTGVKEYWIINPMDKSVEIYTLTKTNQYNCHLMTQLVPDYERAGLTADELKEIPIVITSQLLEGFSISIYDMFKKIP